MNAEPQPRTGPIVLGLFILGQLFFLTVSNLLGFLATLLVPVAEASRDGSWQRVKACRAGDCLWAFYDRSRNRSGVWCNMAVCGNRAKVRTYRQRSPGGERS